MNGNTCTSLLNRFCIGRFFVGAFTLTLMSAASPRGAAATVATDVASNAAYASESGGAWKGLNPTADENPPGSDDGGTGYKPWNFAGGFHYPAQSPYGRLNHFINGVDFPASSFNNLGSPSFGLTNANAASGGATAVAARPFDSPLTIGSVVSLKFDNPVLAALSQFDSAGIVIRLNTGGGPLAQSGVKERFSMFADSGFLSGAWAVGDLAGDNALGVSSNATTSGAEFRFTLTGSETYRLDLFPLSGSTPLASRAGSLARTGTGAIDTIEIILYGNGSGNGLGGAAAQPTGARELFFNNLTISMNSLAGDYDGDGDVDGADFLRWQRSEGSTTGSPADGSGNGKVDAADLAIWKAAFGSHAISGAATLAPEPSTICLSLLLLISRINADGLKSRRIGS
jgi:hypothetical protein